MSDRAPPAVFLSYAREDSAAASRIAEALRSQGVEVWFDQNDLRGGDAWDAKIKKQIRECALFLPVVSAHTQARGEGYFRLEWKLAVERTHLMAEGLPFLAPVAIDETSDSAAAVPPEFLRVQWTRLRGALPTPEFVEQIVCLIAQPRTPAITTAPFVLARPAKRIGFSTAVIITIMVAALGVGGFIAFRPPVTSAPSRESRATETVADSKSIAVLPFENRSSERDSGFFADGVHEDVITNLSYIRGLTVVPRIIAMHYRDTKLRPRNVGAELKVANIVTGSVQRVGKTVRVTAQLINTQTEAATWTLQRNYELTDVMAIQTALATAIAGELRVVISPQEQKLIARRPTESVEAYDAYLKIRANRGGGATRPALEQWEALAARAVELDPKFAEAWAELGVARAAFFQFEFDRSQGLVAKVNEAIETARRLAPDSPEVILAYGEVCFRCYRDFARAVESYNRVIKSQPTNPEVYQQLGAAQRRLGKWPESLSSTRKAVELDPKFSGAWLYLRHSCAFGRRFDEALAARRRMVELSPDNVTTFAATVLDTVRFGRSSDELRSWLATLPADGANARVIDRREAAHLLGDYDDFIRLDRQGAPALPIAWTLSFKGDLAGARARLEPAADAIRRRLVNEPAHAPLWSRLGQMEAVLGHAEEALRCARKATELVPESKDAIDGPTFSHNLAIVRAWNGDKEAAVADLARLLLVPGTQTGQNKPLTVHVMRRDPRYSPLWDHPRFEALLNDRKNNAPLF
jgi:TolB-like protein/tetratricopeptide (TPR) repeat protein